ncbi:BAG family molecular chaperone regulator 6 [Silene latifolia]|uniref:BAG family molecular chaperone regulator 6 n=1 Tax=Silene latifolia TaxID=37657 RepID=UPI003D77BA42
MYPVNSYPYQTPFTPFNFPSWEAFRPQMKEDGANTRPMPEYWPSNYGYTAPMPCQNCCTHGQQSQPSYYSNFRPPCPHFPMPPSYGHYYGGYPAAYPQPYPYPYVPPPHYSMEMPRYEFDKASPQAFHCCECPNHPSHVKTTSNVKIEEQDPDVETKKAAPLIPAGMSSSPHPLMWTPPGYMMNNEQPRRVVDGVNSDEPHVEKLKKSIKPVEQDPNVRYQWLPLDMNSIKRLMEGGELIKPQEQKDGDEKKASDEEKKDQNKQFPYPIIWMPYGGQGEDQTRGQEEKNIGKSPAVKVDERNKAKLPVEERPPTFKLLKHPDKEVLKERIESGDDQGSRKTGVVKIIPVKQLDDPVPKPLKKERESESSKSVKNVESVKNGSDMKPSSPAKKSKLPPICLRVDPPRKKNGKGSSRSPSPPGEKRHQVSSGSKEEEKDKEKIQVMEVVGNAPKGNGVAVPDVTKEEKGSCTREQQSEAEEKVVHTSDSSELNATVSEDNAVHAQESEGVKESEHKESDALERKVLSETEAAVILQSAYRGYSVRRLEPLTKLRHIANVKEEARKVGERVEKLESCVTVNDKEKVAIGEMIMNLLLKLDTIQGLHPSVRDVRKSVTKELIRLQEKLDSIVSQVSGLCLEKKEGEPDEIIAPAEDPSIEIQVDLSTGMKDTPGQLFKDKDQEGNLDAEASDENVENDIQRMEWECDLGAVKTDQVVDRGAAEVSEEIEEQIADIATPGGKCDKDVTSALEMEKVAEKLGEVLVGNDIEIEASGNCNKEQEEDQQICGETNPGAQKPETSDGVKYMELVENSMGEEAPFLEPVIEVEKHVLKDGPVTEPPVSENTPLQSDVGACCNDEDENLNESPQESLLEIEDDICRMEWECDLGAAKFTPGIDEEETQPQESSRGLEKQASEVANSETDGQLDQLNGKTQFQVQSDDFNEVDTENHIIAESCDKKNTDTRESDTASGIPGGSMEVPTVEVEKQMITELPVSEKEECSLDLSTSQTTEQQYDEQINREETKRRIIEENEKLRSMVEKLLASGKEQQNVISSLTAKVNALEKKLPKRRNKVRSGKRPRVVLTRNAS